MSFFTRKAQKYPTTDPSRQIVDLAPRLSGQHEIQPCHFVEQGFRGEMPNLVVPRRGTPRQLDYVKSGHHFPPDVAVGTIRPAKFAKYRSQLGWEPIVLTSAKNTSP